MPRLVTLLWVAGVFVCFADYPAISIGGTVLKVAYAVFPFIFGAVLLLNRMYVNRKQAVLAAIFTCCVLPSVAVSTDLGTSLKFLFGVVVCLAIMGSMYMLTRSIGMKTVGMLVWIYRTTVIVTIPLYALNIQERGHFTLYEPSYWAIALVPYYCIAFQKLLTESKRAFLVDGLLILAAIIVSESVSMFLWVVVSFIGMLIAMRMVRLRYVAACLITFCVLLVVADSLNGRVQAIFEGIGNIGDLDSFLSLMIFVGGQRLQRVLVAYQAASDYPLFGVGLGALRGFTALHYTAADFSIAGMSAPDFDLSAPATNIFLELTAECGITGLLAFLLLLRYIFRQSKNKPAVIPFRVALFVTMLTLMIESSYLRPYVWMLYGISLGVCSLCKDDVGIPAVATS